MHIISNKAEDTIPNNMRSTDSSVSAESGNVQNRYREYVLNEEQLLRIITNMSESVILLETYDNANDFIITRFNTGVGEFEGFSEKILPGKRISEIFPETQNSGLLDEFKNVWLTGKPSSFSMVHLQMRGEIFHRDVYIEKISSSRIMCILKSCSRESESMKIRSMVEESFEMLAEKSQDIVFRYRLLPERRYDYMNPSALKISGYSREEFYKDPFLHEKIVKLEDFNFISENLYTGGFFKKPLVVSCTKKDGSNVFLEIKCTPVYDSTGNLTSIGGIARDVTRRINLEKSLKNSNKELEELINEIPGIVFRLFLDEDRVNYVSEKCQEITGFSKSELSNPSFSWLSRIIEEDRAAYSSLIESAVENIEAYELEYGYIKKNGEVRNFIEYGSVFLDEDNKKKIVGFISDITNHKKLQERLNESQQAYRSIFENEHAPMMLLDPEGGDIIDANKAALNFYGYKYLEITSMKISNINILSVEQVKKELRSASEKKRDFFKFTHRLSDGSLRDVEVHSGPIFIEGKKLLFSIVHDKTTENKMEKELLETVSRTRELFLDTVNLTGKMVELRDPYTAGHQRRVSALAVRIAKKLDFPNERIEAIGVAGLLHDSGKVSIPSEILSRPGKLSRIEWELMKQHPEISSKILSEMKYPWDLEKIVLQHHERLDGSGYPIGLKGEEITFEARIIGVADVVEAMASHRPYRPAFSIEQALAEIKLQSGKLYDPEVVEACIEVFREGFEFDKE